MCICCDELNRFMSVHSWVQLHDTICFVFLSRSVRLPPLHVPCSASAFLKLFLLLFVLLRLKTECVNASLSLCVRGFFSVSTFLNRICKVYLFFFPPLCCCFFFSSRCRWMCAFVVKVLLFSLLNLPKTMEHSLDNMDRGRTIHRIQFIWEQAIFIYMCSQSFSSHESSAGKKSHVNRQSGIEKINKMFLSLRFPLSSLMWITNYGRITRTRTTTALVYWAIFDFFLFRNSLSSKRFNWSRLPTCSYCPLNLQWKKEKVRESELGVNYEWEELSIYTF